jgi:hypothetical protein
MIETTYSSLVEINLTQLIRQLSAPKARTALDLLQLEILTALRTLAPDRTRTLAANLGQF